MTAIFALAGALIIGAADYGGGVAARQASPFRVTAWIQASSLVTIALAVWFVDAPSVTSTDISAGVVAGLSGTFSFVALYAAFARGQISVLAPTTAIVGAVVPTVVGVFRGEDMNGAKIVGIAFALVAIALVTRGHGSADGPRKTPPVAFGLALLAGSGFSIFFLALAETDANAGLWPLVAARVVSVPVVALMAVVVSGGLVMPRPAWRVALVAGVAEAVANVFALWSYQRGPLAVAAVLGAFFPVSSVVLARIFLHEQLQRIQLVGVGLALVSVPLIAVP